MYTAMFTAARHRRGPVRTHRAVMGTSLVALLVVISACRSPLVKPSLPVQPPIAQINAVPGATRYEVDGAASSVHILVYRGGAMARLGHNHVVSSSNVAGTLWLHADLSRSKLQVTMPVNSLSVDDAAMRATEGADFAAEVPQDAREGTRRNLLRTEVLDGEHFPYVTLQSTAISGTRAAPTLILRVTIKDVQREVIVPTHVKEDRNLLVATGQFEIKQSDFGITPFSVALGTLQVVDTLKIKFSLVARQQQ